MANIRPFRAFRPAMGLEGKVAALPYDVFSREEAREYVKNHPDSFLAIDRAESVLPEEVGTYEDVVYAKAAEMLKQKMEDGTFLQDQKPCFYLYEQTWQGRSQTGITACASIDDYESGVIKKHENTVEAKEQDRIRHVDTCNTQTGPIFLAYRDNEAIDAVTRRVKEQTPVCDFISAGEVRNRVWVISEESEVAVIREAFAGIDRIYIADGHHRAASAVRVGQKRRMENPGYTGEEAFNFFLCILFPESELKILDYNRVVKDLGGQSKAEILERLRPNFNIMPYRRNVARPSAKGEIGMYLDHSWFLLTAKNNVKSGDAVKGLDVSILQDRVLAPVFGIENPRADARIDFVGGIRGAEELMERADASQGAAFLMFPTSIQELFRVADAGKLMPPKSTWFEPKLLSGLFLHSLKD